MKLEAITVCVNYSDFLAVAIEHNFQHFDSWTIITTEEDKATIELCRKRNLRVITTNEFYREGDLKTFNKGRAISLALNFPSTDAWVLHIDADMVLPINTRQMLEIAHLDPTCIYGIDRICCQTYEEWIELLKSGYLHDQHGYHLCVNFPSKYKMGIRVFRDDYGYVPIGFFQLFNNKEGIHSGMRWKKYPHTDSDASHSDIKFALHWDRRKRVLLPEIIGVHLESEPSNIGVNWRGRKTIPFGPKHQHTSDVLGKSYGDNK